MAYMASSEFIRTAGLNNQLLWPVRLAGSEILAQFSDRQDFGIKIPQETTQTHHEALCQTVISGHAHLPPKAK
jgi:hypothetical protein